jgi:hypothetical protein
MPAVLFQTSPGLAMESAVVAFLATTDESSVSMKEAANHGYALEPSTGRNLFNAASDSNVLYDGCGDIRNYSGLEA